MNKQDKWGKFKPVSPYLIPEQGVNIPDMRIQGLQEVVIVPASIEQVSLCWCLDIQAGRCESSSVTIAGFIVGIQGPVLVSAVQQACSKNRKI